MKRDELQQRIKELEERVKKLELENKALKTSPDAESPAKRPPSRRYFLKAVSAGAAGLGLAGLA